MPDTVSRERFAALHDFGTPPRSLAPATPPVLNSAAMALAEKNHPDIELGVLRTHLLTLVLLLRR
jgi:hypothetical protein